MKKIICILCPLLLLTLVWGQQPPGIFTIRNSGNPVTTSDEAKLTHFDLDFSGGTPADLVNAIEKATGKPLNVIIPTDGADTQLPPLKMSDVVVPQLFSAIEAASRQTVYVQMSGFNGNQQDTSYGFKISDGPVTDTSIWYFYAQKPILPVVDSTEKVCRFYQLQPYLNHGFTVDDITTAIQTGWKMAGIVSPPELNYHKETNLLIACGNPKDLENIYNVLQTLPGTYIDKSQMDYVETEAKKVDDLEAQIDKLEKEVSALTAHSTENSSGK